MSKKQTTKQNSDSTARALRPILYYAGVVLALLLVCALIIQLMQLRAVNQEQLERASVNQVRAYGVAISRFVLDQQVYLQSLTHDPEILKAVRDRDSLALRTLESRFTTAYATASQLHIIPLNKLGTAARDFPDQRLNSIETAMIVDAHRGKKVSPETYRKGPQNVITLLQVIGQGDVVEGVLLLSINGQVLGRIMSDLLGNQGALALHQRVGSDSIEMFAIGTSAAQAPAARAAVPGLDKWELVFRGSAAFIAASKAAPGLSWLVLLAAGLALMGFGAVLFRHLQKRLDQKFDQLLDYLARLNQGERALPPALEIRQLTAIGGLAFELSQKPPISGKPSQVDAAATAQLSEKMSGKKAAPPSRKGIATADVETLAEETAAPAIAPGLFRAYDIRGIVGQDLTADAVYHIGLAVGSTALARGETAVLVGRDGRLSSEELSERLAAGIQDSGLDVIDLGAVPTPVLYFGTQQLNTSSGVMVTGSHNPPEYNGLKIVIGGQTLSGEGIQALRRRIEQGQLSKGAGSYNTIDLIDQYIDYVLGDIAVAQPLKLVIDCGNGIAGRVAPRLFEDLGCEVVPLYCEVDGNFPNHHPDPTVADNLKALISRVRSEKADLGIAFDGDGDRLGVVSSSGEIIPADRLLMLFAQDVVSRNPGCDVVFDVKCSRHLNDVIAGYGGRPVMWKSGHSMIKQKMVETGALLGGEFSGHIFFKERWFGFDDGLYSAARLIEIMSTTNPDLDQLMEQFPKTVNTPEIQLEVGEHRKFAVMDNLAGAADFGDAKITRIDGIRVDLPDSWGLIRASNTTPRLTLRFEAESSDAMAHIKELFAGELKRLEPQLNASF